MRPAAHVVPDAEGERDRRWFETVERRASLALGHATVGVESRLHGPPQRIEDAYRFTGVRLKSTRMAIAREDASIKVAVRTYDLSHMSDIELECMRGAVVALLCLDHPHVARLVDVYEEPGSLHMVVEFLGGGELLDSLVGRDHRGHFEEDDCREAVWQIILAVAYIHSVGLVHGDLTIQRFLYEETGPKHLKLSDFGHASGVIGSSEAWVESMSPAAWITSSKKLSPRTNWRPAESHADRGSKSWKFRAPEVSQTELHTDPQCDLWSVGMLTYVLLTGRFPFAGKTRPEFESAEKRSQLEWGSDARASEQARAFVGRLLVVCPSQRMTAHEALRHPWMAPQEERRRGRPSVDAQLAGSIVSFSKAPLLRRACAQLMAWYVPGSSDCLRLRSAFIELDTECKGYVDESDFCWALAALNIPQERVREVFAAMDINADGKVCYSEFVAALVYTRVPLNEELVRRSFKCFDNDNDSVISSEELRAVFGNFASPEELLRGLELDVDRGSEGLTVDALISYVVSGQHDDLPPELRALSEKKLTPRTPRGGPKARSSQGGRGNRCFWGGLLDCCTARGREPAVVPVVGKS